GRTFAVAMSSLTPRFVTAILLVIAPLLPGCGALPRLPAVPPWSTESAAVPGIPGCRYWIDRDIEPFIQSVLRDNEREREALTKAGLPTDPLPPVDFLAISGGGDAGAFAAGVLAGW